MRTLELFAGICGFGLAARRLAWETAAFVEWDPFCQKIIAKNFPNVPIYGDIKGFSYESERERIGTIDLVCGGFPCQPFSHAGKRAGRNDERHLWPEMLRVVRETQPAFVVGENVAGIISMDGGDLLEEILTDLESEGYVVQPFVVPAISVGAPHRRDRVWIVADRQSAERQQSGGTWARRERFTDDIGNAANTQRERLEGAKRIQGTALPSEGDREDSWHSDQSRLGGCGQYGECARERPSGSPDWQTHWYEAALATCNVRMDDGLSAELDFVGARDNRTARLKALGNAIVPQVAYQIFQAIQQTYQP